MIEKFMTMIIQELGPTGLLILGMYWIFQKHLKCMCDHIIVMNHEMGEIRDLIKEYMLRHEKK
jgi:hypothetical protein